jgi:hypothetical protein
MDGVHRSPTKGKLENAKLLAPAKTDVNVSLQEPVTTLTTYLYENKQDISNSKSKTNCYMEFEKELRETERGVVFGQWQ